jgi:ankyrin repeat protein
MEHPLGAPRKRKSKSTRESHPMAASLGYVAAHGALAQQWSSCCADGEPAAMLLARDALLAWNGANAILDPRLRSGSDPLVYFDLDELLARACSKNHACAIPLLVGAGASLTKPTQRRSPMSHAAAHGSLEAISELALLGALANMGAGESSIDEKTLAPMGETPMIAAAFGGRETAMELLISLGADIDKQDSEGYTPLHWAATAGRDTTISWLLTHGADPRARNLRGETALMMSCRKGHGPASAVLAQANLSWLDERDLKGDTASHHAARSARSAALTELAHAGADLTVCGYEGLTPLGIAQRGGRIELVESVLAIAEKRALLADISTPPVRIVLAPRL